ncbi:MAG: hypothetical protein GWM88_04840 [Pseudomonadales bacterium]|nr:hypothetical protein [Pseudomonadales bacterium]NIX07368.1 hypothetical protein [Pseudomonadales bacterium]
MTDIPDVGAQDPELKNSPIALESDEETVLLREEIPDEPFCYFNSEAFPNEAVVKSGPMKLRCDHGIWVPIN